MRNTCIAIIALIAILGSALTANAQCPGVKVTNNGPCTVNVFLLGNNAMGVVQVAPGQLGFLNAPPGGFWFRVTQVWTIAPCAAIWQQMVNLPTGPGVIAQAPLPAPYNAIAVNGCNITLW